MGLKENCKLASWVLETRVPYQSWASETRFPLAEFAELDMIMPHRSRVFYTQFQTENKKHANPEKEERTWRKKEPRKKNEDLRRREEPIEDLKKERRDSG